METLLVHRAVAQDFLALVAKEFTPRGVSLHADAAAFEILNGLGFSLLAPATADSWTTEYLDLIASVGVVDDVDAAIDHIEQFGSHHSDAIVTEDSATAEHFLHRVDSATVFWNASTRFNDGGEFGFGAEIGISTDKLHARGPMALEELTTYKYLIRGNGQIRE
jgi:glutamate-5-semialdehyde dehydrogenase